MPYRVDAYKAPITELQEMPHVAVISPRGHHVTRDAVESGIAAVLGIPDRLGFLDADLPEEQWEALVRPRALEHLDHVSHRGLLGGGSPPTRRDDHPNHNRRRRWWN